MRQRTRALASLLSVLALLPACSTEPGTSAPIDGGTADLDTGPATTDDTGPRPDTGTRSGYVPHDGGYADGGTATAFTGATDTWQAVPIEDARCGNGSPLLVGVSLSDRSSDVVVYFQGGGACWDATTCFQFGTASHVQDTLTADDVLYEAANGGTFLLTRDAANPYRDASFVYIPYCTGDAHAGTNVATFTYMGQERDMHFEGGHNAELVLARAAATWPSAGRVTLVGVSAGGYGVMANWFRARAMFPGTRVDAIDDSGLPVDMPASRWRTVSEAWGIDFPVDCTTCDSMGDTLPYYATTAPLPSRYALLAYLDDSVIPTFYGTTGAVLGRALTTLRTTTMATTNQRTYYVDQTGHVLLGDPTQHAATGPNVGEWITQFATDDPAWTDVGP